jgi:hypothetical protein
MESRQNACLSASSPKTSYIAGRSRGTFRRPQANPGVKGLNEDRYCSRKHADRESLSTAGLFMPRDGIPRIGIKAVLSLFFPFFRKNAPFP